MVNYIVIKNLPDACVGTDVMWDTSANSYYYKKSAYVSPNDTTFLTAGQVTQNPEFFCKDVDYPEYFAYKHPVYNREEIISLIEECFPDKRMSGDYQISASNEIELFRKKLRELGKTNAKKIINKI